MNIRFGPCFRVYYTSQLGLRDGLRPRSPVLVAALPVL